MNMRRLLGLVLGALLLAGAAPAGATRPADTIDVATRNLYLGADLTPVVFAQDEAQFIAAATDALNRIAANDFPLRAEALAREFRSKQPDVIGLQEASAFMLNGTTPGPPFVDMLHEMLQAMEEVGLHYEVAGVVENLDVTLPLDVTGDSVPDAIRALDRDVILVKDGIPYQPVAGNYLIGGLCGVPVPNPAFPAIPPAVFQSSQSADGCNFTIFGSVNLPLQPPIELKIKRGFVGVDVIVRGRKYRVVSTHLEERRPDPSNPGSAVLQSLQSVELAGTLQATTPEDRTLIVLGDFNSSPEDVVAGGIMPPYQVMEAGFRDTWGANPLKGFGPEGFTCCEDEDLANVPSMASERIDQIWTGKGEKLMPLDFLIGRPPLPPLNAPPNWASDHRGVFGELVFLNR
jgi:endonuclease/exonuclease/phosphatase family metal-dependent hydrolase